MTPSDILFVLPWGFLETGAQQLSEWVRIPLFPELSIDPMPRAVPKLQGCSPGLCQARGVPLFVLSHSDPLPWDFVSTRSARFHGLKLSQTLLAEHLNRATLSSHQKSTRTSGAFQKRYSAEEATNDHGDKVSLTLTHIRCVSYR